MEGNRFEDAVFRIRDSAIATQPDEIVSLLNRVSPQSDKGLLAKTPKPVARLPRSPGFQVGFCGGTPASQRQCDNAHLGCSDSHACATC